MRVTRAARRAGKPIHEDEDASPTTTSPAASAPELVLQDITTKNSLVIETPQTPKAAIQNSISESVLSQAILSKTPKFDPEVHTEVVNTEEDANGGESTKEDSFVEHIIARSPAKSVSRIEDSVEAMDALEDAIEQVSQDLPVIEDIQLQSPVKSRKASPKPAPKPASKPAPSKLSSKKPEPTPRQASTVKATHSARKTSPTKKAGTVAAPQPKTATARPSTANPVKRTSPAAKMTVGRPSMATANKRPSLATHASRKPPTAKTPTSKPKPAAIVTKSPPAPLPNTQKRKVSASLSTSKPGFIPSKSSKPATTSTFTLPGEAIAAKLKAQREDRQKREEAAEQSKKDMKPKPRLSKAPRPAASLPRQTKTSQARLSMIAVGDKKVAAPRVVSATTKDDGISSVVKGRGAGQVRAKSGVRRTTITPSGTTIAPPAEKKVDAAELRARAKKAREEAAEKGRIASREWAEKQKKRAMGSAVAKAQTIAEERPVEVVAA